jgi:hypothetical protein
MSTGETKIVAQKELMYHVSHDKDSVDPFRNSCFDRINELMSNFQRTIRASSVFLRNEEDMKRYLGGLPRSYLNLGLNSKIGENEVIITQERMVGAWEFWRNSLEVRSRSRAYFGNLEKQIRRFSLHISIFNAIEEFLHSDKKYLITFEDDEWLVDDFETIIQYVIDSLPENWDIFNFVVPENDKHWFNERLKIESTILSVSYQTWSAACVMHSRVGARKVLSRYLFEYSNFEVGDPNGDINLDNLIYNYEFFPPFDVEMLNYKTSFMPDRYLQNYTFQPDQPPVVDQNVEVASTWQ